MIVVLDDDAFVLDFPQRADKRRRVGILLVGAVGSLTWRIAAAARESYPGTAENDLAKPRQAGQQENCQDVRKPARHISSERRLQRRGFEINPAPASITYVVTRAAEMSGIRKFGYTP